MQKLSQLIPQCGYIDCWRTRSNLAIPCRGFIHSATLVKTITCAIDRKTLFIQQLTNATDQQNFMMLVISAVTASLDRFKLCELLLPITQDVRFHTTKLAHLSNREITLGGNRRQLIVMSVLRHMPLLPCS